MAYASVPASGGGGGTPANGSITSAMLRDSAGLSVIGRSANTTGVPADIVAANDTEIMRRSGTSIGFGNIALGAITPGAANRIPFGNSGNTGLTSAASLSWTDSTGVLTAGASTTTILQSISTLTTASAEFRATNNANRRLQMLMYGATAAGTLAGVNRTNLSSITDVAATTPPDAFILHTQGATDMVFAVANTEAFRVINGTRQIRFGAGSITANGVGAVTPPLTNGPAAISVLEWLTVTNPAGNTRYLPLYG